MKNNDRGPENVRLAPIKLCRVATVPLTFRLLFEEQFRAIVSSGIELTIVSAPGKDLEDMRTQRGFSVKPISMSRHISPWSDFRALKELVALFREKSFDIVHSCTPKAGFLTALAGFVARVPIRVHTYTGQVWVELGGWKRCALRSCDWLVGHLDTQLYADSRSQMKFLIESGIVQAKRISVIGPGSVSGVNLERFDSCRVERAEDLKVRAELGIDPDALVVVFVGRITRDKGICELIRAFKDLCIPGQKVELVLVGPLDQVRERLPESVLGEIRENPRIHAVGFVPAQERYMRIATVLCLPSYREGFGSTVIEAAALGVPTVGTSIVGLTDAVVDGRTGILVPPKDPDALARALRRILTDGALRASMGREAQGRVREQFDARRINELVVAEYLHLSTRLWRRGR